jgi:integrase
MALTIKRIARLTKPGRYGDGHGLLLQIGTTGAKSWLLRYERNGRERALGLGPLHTINLDQARLRANAARMKLLDGIDPIDDKRAARARQAADAAKVVSFRDCAMQYQLVHEKKWNNRKFRLQFMSSLQAYAFPSLGSLPVATIDKAMVLKCLRPIWESRTTTAERVRRRIATVLDYATASGLRQGDNPARWGGNLEFLLPSPSEIKQVRHHGALPYSEIGVFMSELGKREGIAERALEFAILTAARTGEVIGATWDEIDLKGHRWTIPASRMKTGKETNKDHTVPLSPRAIEILKALPREANDFVFIGSRKGMAIGPNAMRAALGRSDITVHGFRSTFRDWAAETTAYPNHVVEMALAHSIGSAVEKAYRRGDLFEKRRKLMDTWAAFCARPQGSATTPLRRKAAV